MCVCVCVLCVCVCVCVLCACVCVHYVGSRTECYKAQSVLEKEAAGGDVEDAGCGLEGNPEGE